LCDTQRFFTDNMAVACRGGKNGAIALDIRERGASKKVKEKISFINLRLVVFKHRPILSRAAMFKLNGLLSTQLCHYLNQSPILNNRLMRAAH